MAQLGKEATMFFAVDEDDGRRFQTGEHLSPLSVQIGGELATAVAFLKTAEVKVSRYGRQTWTLCQTVLAGSRVADAGKRFGCQSDPSFV